MSIHARTDLLFHFVFCPKYRRKIFTDIEVRNCIKNSIIAKCNALHCRILKMSFESDHVHILVFLPPVLSVSQFAKHVKGFSSRIIHQNINNVQNPFWSRGYFAVSAGYTAVSLIKRYLNEQGIDSNATV